MYVNGVPYSFSSLGIAAGPIMGGARQYYEAQAISYKHGMERGELRGNSQGLLGVTNGQYKPEASMEFGLDAAFSFKRSLGDGWMNVPFHVTLTFGSDDGTRMHIVNFDAKLKEDSVDGSKGVEPMTGKMPMQVLGTINEDGMDPLGFGYAIDAF